MKTTQLCSTIILLMSTIGCSSAPKPVVKQEEPITGLTALYRAFSTARAWAPDVQILRVSSVNLPDIKSEPGHAPAWQVTLVSPSLGQMRSYTYSVVEASATMRKGIFSDNPQPWSRDTSSAKPFIIAAAKKDTDEIYKTVIAQKKATEYSAKHPGMPISYLLELNSTSPDAVWRVIWGESASRSEFSGVVDATTGQFLESLT